MTDLAAMVCTCGHSAYWHQGCCDKCDCPKFSLARIDTYESLRGEIARLTKERPA